MPVVAQTPLAGFNRGPAAPYPFATLVTPSDTDDLAVACTALLISVDGALKVDLEGASGGSPVTLTFPTGTFPVKTFIPLRVRRVYATGTSATGIVVFR
jgi:hypothetical protein